MRKFRVFMYAQQYYWSLRKHKSDEEGKLTDTAALLGLLHNEGGSYSWLPLGYRVRAQISDVLRSSLQQVMPVFPSDMQEDIRTFWKSVGSHVRSFHDFPLTFYGAYSGPVATSGAFVKSGGEYRAILKDKLGQDDMISSCKMAINHVLTRLGLVSFCEWQESADHDLTLWFNHDDERICLAWLLVDDALPVWYLANNSRQCQACGFHVFFDFLAWLRAVIRVHSCDTGIMWPRPLCVFDAVIIPVNYHKSYRVRSFSEDVLKLGALLDLKLVVDNRKLRPGMLFADADLLGVKHRVIVDERDLDVDRLLHRIQLDHEPIIWNDASMQDRIQACLSAIVRDISA